MVMAEDISMQTFIGIIIIAIFAGLTLGQPDRPPPPTNCTKTFDHSYSLDELLEEFRDDDIRYNMRKAAPIFWSASPSKGSGTIQHRTIVSVDGD